MSADRVKWEHIHRVFELCNRNVSETARRLKCIEELFKGFYLKDRLNKFFLILSIFLVKK